jgi:hypothetical protein
MLEFSTPEKAGTTSTLNDLNDLNGALLPAPSNKMNETLGKLHQAQNQVKAHSNLFLTS